MHLQRRLCLVALLSGLAGAGRGQGDVPTLTSAELRSKVTRNIAAKFDEDIAFTLAPGDAVCVQLAPNPYDVVDVVVHSAGDLIWLDYGGAPTAKNWKRCTGALEQLGRAPCAALVHWTAGDWSLQVGLRLSADREGIAPILDGIRRAERNWALRLSNGSLDLPAKVAEAERIAGFARLWSEVKYNFVFFDRVPELDWERVLDDYMPRVRAAETAPAYYKVLRECMALLHDGHSEAWGPSDEPTATLPILLAEIEGKAVVVAVRSPDTIRDEGRRRELETAGIARGDEVTAIDGEPVAAILRRRIVPYLSSSTPGHLAMKAYAMLGDGEPGTQARLSVQPLQGEAREAVLTRGYLTANSGAARRAEGDVGDGVVYVLIDSFANEASVQHFEAELARIRQARALILDLRRNGGGNTKYAARILGYLTDTKLPGSRWKTRVHRPAFKAWGQPETWHEGSHDDVRPAENPFLGPVVVLIGPRTFSAAEDFLVVLKAAGRATLVGERSGGSTGQPLVITGLPGGGGARVCAKRDTFPDGTEFVGIGVIPDVEVRPTRSDIAAGRDVVFDRGLAEAKRLAAR